MNYRVDLPFAVLPFGEVMTILSQSCDKENAYLCYVEFDSLGFIAASAAC